MERRILDLYAPDEQSSRLWPTVQISPSLSSLANLYSCSCSCSLRKHARSRHLVRTKCKYQSKLPGCAAPTYITTIMDAMAISSSSLPSSSVMKLPALSPPSRLRPRRTVHLHRLPSHLLTSGTESPSKLACHVDRVTFARLAATTFAQSLASDPQPRHSHTPTVRFKLRSHILRICVTAYPTTSALSRGP